ncbi:MAG: bifunctional diaminohydroxyphosphoribosylaminopyrimidine deaminase/5-amino-6-(5-phosphoribosylamino)uracil reductase RibD [Oscillospiraceae bacterium]
MTHAEYMKFAINLAKNGCGFTNPNPMVGAIIVKDGNIIGSGHHQRYGELHAERNALANVTRSPEGSTLYVTLEPCCHYGKTPPCTEAIIEAKIKTVVVGSLDPNPLVAGNGIRILRENGIEVITGVLEDECNKLNEVFLHFIKTKTPYVVMKYAMTLDGKIATHLGKSKWITAEPAREHVHLSRHKYSAIMVGVNTVIADNPQLTCRIPTGKNPIRIICDTNLRIPLDSAIVTTAKEVPTYIASACEDNDKIQQLTELGCKVITVPLADRHIDLNILMQLLGEKNIDSILLEGGSSLNFSALNSGIVNKIQAYIAPKIFGGTDAKTPVGGMGVDTPNDCFKLINREVTFLGQDILIEYEVENNVYRHS